MSTISKSNTYIHFKDNCLEAMSFYQSCFGGELMVMKVADTPMVAQMPGMENMVMHAQLTGDGWAIMASDWCCPTEYKSGNNFSVMMECSSEQEQTSLYDKLAEGGKASMPLSDTFWGSRFGMVKDKFGIDWMLSVPK
jgi:PhnB protein